MTEQLQTANPDLESTSREGEQANWPWALYLGLLLGAVASFVAAFRRWARLAEERTLPQIQPAEALPATPKSTPGDVKPAVTKPTPVAPERLSVAGAVREPAEKPPQPGPVRPVTSTRWREATKYVVGVGLFLAVLLILYLSRSVIPVIVLAALLALIVHPVIGFFQRRLKFSRGLSIAVTYLLIIALLVLIPLVVVPNLIQSINDLVNIDFQGWSQSTAQKLQELSATVAQIPLLNALLVPFLESMSTALQGISSVSPPEPVPYQAAVGGLIDRLGQTLGTIAKVLGPVVSAITSLVFMLLVSFYLSLSGQQLLEGYPRLLPPAYEPEISGLIQRIQGVWVAFLRGQVTLMILIGVMVWLGNALLGNRHALLLGIISGTLEIIPSLGPALALIPGVGMALIFGSSHFALSPLTFALIVLAYYLVVQVVENQLVVPYVLGGAVEVPPLVVIIGVMVGGTVAGILGILLATPIIATGREVFTYLYDKILEPPKAEEPPEEKPSLLDTVRNRVKQLRLPFGRRAKQPPTAEQEAI